MGYLKLFICALLVAAVAASPYEVFEDDTKAEDLGKLIANITGTFHKVNNAAQKFVASLIKDEIDSFQKATVKEVRKVFGDVKNYIFKVLDEMQPQFNADALKVIKCHETRGQDIINVIVDYYDQTTKCFNPSLKTVLTKVGPLITDLDKVDTTVETLGVEVTKCNNDICILGVVRKIITAINSIVDVLEKDVPPLVDNIKALVDSVKSCAVKNANPWKKEAADLLNKIATCIRS